MRPCQQHIQSKLLHGIGVMLSKFWKKSWQQLSERIAIEFTISAPILSPAFSALLPFYIRNQNLPLFSSA
jgi:hypothetical protein